MSPSRVTVGAGTAVGSVVLFAPTAHAATFTVTNLNDAGAGSLRQAVLDANLDATADTIVFQTGLSGQITLTTGQLGLNEPVDIQGPGANVITVSGNDASRIFYIQPNTAGDPSSISGLTLTQGYFNGSGGAVYVNEARLTLSGLVISDSNADDGAGVYSQDTGLQVLSTQFSGNNADEAGGGIYIDNSFLSGGLYDPILIRDSVFSGNHADDAGGGAYLYDISSAWAIERSTVSGNDADDEGGGIAVEDIYDDTDPADVGSLTIDSTTVSGNTSDAAGGGIAFFEEQYRVTIVNSTISGNSSATTGGGLYFGADGEADDIRRVDNSTVANNSASTSGGGIYLNDHTLFLSSTIVGDNSSPDGPDLGFAAAATTPGVFDSGFSLIENPAGATITDNPAGSNITGTDPQLGPLAANDGPTQTHLPARTSPAIDAGAANALASDQRGFARTVDLALNPNPTADPTDVGAVEVRGGACKGQVIFADFPVTDGDDLVNGSDDADSIAALAGNDTVNGLAGGDCLFGDANNDTVKGGPDADQVRGGNGTDKGRGQGGKDSVKGQAGNDNVAGGGGNDKVIGGDGKDIVKGGGGKDKLKGNAGKDKLKARDGEKDKVNCGGGNDKATVDDKDKVSNNCETVNT
jgi:predicted outer membrane repeat protein